MALSWDRAGSRALDLDLQALAFDSHGKLLDAVYYNNLKGLGRGITHSGDELTGDKANFDEVVWVNLASLQATVQLVVFVVACYSGGHLKDAKNGHFHVLEDRPDNETGKFRLEKSDEEVDLVGGLMRSGRGWVLRLVDVPAQDGQHFIDILEPTIGNFVRQVIPGAPRRIKAAFAMEKGSMVDLPKSSALKHINAGLGWDTASGDVDLDVSAVLLKQDGSVLDAVFFGNLQTAGVTHSGDNLTGQGSGDDEVISIALERISPLVQQILFVINIYTSGRTFAQVANPYCRISDVNGEEFCQYRLHEAGNQQGLIIARLVREPGNVRWGFQAIGVPCRGKTWQDSMPQVMSYAQAPPKQIQAASGPSRAGPDLSRSPSVVHEECKCAVQ